MNNYWLNKRKQSIKEKSKYEILKFEYNKEKRRNENDKRFIERDFLLNS